MKYLKLISSILFLLFFLSTCKKSENKNLKLPSKTPVSAENPIRFKEEVYVINKTYILGDVRRYGIFPDSSYSYIHPITKIPKITTVLDLAEKHNITLFFPKGYYKTALILDGRENLSIRFDNAEFDLIHITQDVKTKKKPKNISLKGTVISYDRLGITEATNIEIDTVFLKSNTKKSIRKMRSRGCHIYHGSKFITIKYLVIEDLGSGDKRYHNSHAALALDGWGNNPENVTIDKLHIKSSDRHGIYLTGKNHVIKEVIIDQFGIGSDKEMAPMQDGSDIEYKLFAGIWINRCYNSKIGKITINAKNSEGYFVANFDEGDSLRPVNIRELKIKNADRTLPINFAKNAGVIVQKYTEIK